MDHDFTRRDRLALARGMIRRHPAERETWNYLITHKLRQLMPLAIQARLDDATEDYVEDALEMSRLFKLELSLRQLELVFFYEEDQFDTDRTLKYATMLAKRSAKWRQRLPRIIEKLRQSAMKEIDIERVMKYGRLLNRALHTHEIIAMIASAHDGAEFNTYKQKAEHKLYELLYARTCELLKLKPVADKPAG